MRKMLPMIVAVVVTLATSVLAVDAGCVTCCGQMDQSILGCCDVDRSARSICEVTVSLEGVWICEASGYCEFISVTPGGSPASHLPGPVNLQKT